MTDIVTIAGSDPSGAAGLQADLKTIMVCGGHGSAVVTAVTAQTSSAVQAVFRVPLDVIESQIDAVFHDVTVAAVKIGMLGDAGAVHVVAEGLRRYHAQRVVLDPVFEATDGTSLLTQEGRRVLKEKLMPLCLIITPNLAEAGILAEMQIASVDDMKEAARRIVDRGARSVLVKGGHLTGDPVDLFFDGSTFTRVEGRRLPGPEVHGTGCILSSALATELGKGVPLRRAVQTAVDFVRRGIEGAQRLGSGQSFVDFQVYLRHVVRNQPEAE
jgi:hydroxymethylpyrimidine/phosphomethylpyrimidine kinase